VPSSSPLRALVQTAARLQCRTLALGVSARMDVGELARKIGLAWEDLPEPRPPLSLVVINKEKRPMYINLGPHPPRLWPEDVERLHEIWLSLTEDEGLGAKLHHRDVVSFALRRLEEELKGAGHQKLVSEIMRAFPHVRIHSRRRD